MGRIVHSPYQELSFVPFFLPRRWSPIPTPTRGHVSDEITRTRLSGGRSLGRSRVNGERGDDRGAESRSRSRKHGCDSLAAGPFAGTAVCPAQSRAAASCALSRKLPTASVTCSGHVPLTSHARAGSASSFRLSPHGHPKPPCRRNLPLKEREIRPRHFGCLLFIPHFNSVALRARLTLLPLQGEGRDGDGSPVHRTTAFPNVRSQNALEVTWKFFRSAGSYYRHLAQPKSLNE